MTTTTRRVPATRSTALLVVGILLVAANLRPALTSVGPVLPELSADLGLGAAAAGALNALPLVAFAVVALVTPALGRAVGTERVLVGGLVLLVAGSALRSLSGQAGLFAGTVVLSVGIGSANVLLPVLVRATVPRRVGLVTSWYAATLTLMAAAASGLAAPIAQAAGGWRTALGCWAVLGVVTALVWAPAAVRRGPPAAGPASTGGAGPSPWRSATAWSVAVFFALQSATFYSVVAWLPTVLADRGLSPTSAGVHLLVFQLTGLAAGLVLPLVLRGRRDQRSAAVVGALVATVGYAGLAVLPDVGAGWVSAATWACVVLTGAGAGIMFTLALTLLVLRAADGDGAARLSAMAQSSGYLVGAAGPVAVGVLREATGGWAVPLALLAAVAAGAAVSGSRAGMARTVGRAGSGAAGQGRSGAAAQHP